MGFSNLLAEEAYYWNYAEHLDFGYLDHPPMVAYLIKFFTQLFGNSETAVRIAAILCWLLTCFFSFKLSELIKTGGGKYAVFFLAILPFFFIHALIITPDLPLLVCWAASLYYLYLALVYEKEQSWYLVGLWLGLGLLSKYSIVLLGLATFIYMAFIKPFLFFRKEPYIAALLALIIFSPVIYWNAEHSWASFIFQSTRRIHEISKGSLHELLGLSIAFLTPAGVYSLLKLFKASRDVEKVSREFILIFTFTPLIVFTIFSLQHEIKFNWIGPIFLALIPWLAISITKTKKLLMKAWFGTSVILLISYSLIIFSICSGKPTIFHRLVLNKYIAWDALTLDLVNLAKQTEYEKQAKPIFIPLDRYNIASELNFYQAKFLSKKIISQTYAVFGSHIFGGESLMYSYWDKTKDHHGKLAILISTYFERFYYPEVRKKSIPLSGIQEIWAHSQGRNTHQIRKYYYQLIKLV